jgi:uncharacterized membrane protein
MSVTRLIPIPALVIDLVMLAQVMAAGAGYLILAADERSVRDGVPGSADAKAESGELKRMTSEKTAAITPVTQDPAGDKRAASSELSESRAPRKPNASTAKSQEQKISTEKSLSILQMLEGHETELAVAVAIALAFFFIGWICGGNYYLRHDRRRRTKLRF